MKQEPRDIAYWANEHQKWCNSGEDQETYCKKEGLLFREFKAGVKKARAAGLLYKKNQSNSEVRVRKVSAFKRISLEPGRSNLDKASPAYCDIWFEGRLSIRIETAESLVRLGELIKGLVR